MRIAYRAKVRHGILPRRRACSPENVEPDALHSCRYEDLAAARRLGGKLMRPEAICGGIVRRVRQNIGHCLARVQTPGACRRWNCVASAAAEDIGSRNPFVSPCASGEMLPERLYDRWKYDDESTMQLQSFPSPDATRQASWAATTRHRESHTCRRMM